MCTVACASAADSNARERAAVRPSLRKRPTWTSTNWMPNSSRGEVQLIAAVNVERQKEGLLPLRWNRNLSDVARWFARDARSRVPLAATPTACNMAPAHAFASSATKVLPSGVRR